MKTTQQRKKREEHGKRERGRGRGREREKERERQTEKIERFSEKERKKKPSKTQRTKDDVWSQAHRNAEQNVQKKEKRVCVEGGEGGGRRKKPTNSFPCFTSWPCVLS
jgi:hypothetical protein